MPKPTRSKPRPVYRHSELDRVLNPGSIAIVGASPTLGSFGDRVLGHLGTFTDDVFLVNPKYERIGERPCYASLRELPSSPDCVAVVVPRESVEPIVRDAASVRAGGVILYASGYAEMQRQIDGQAHIAEVSIRTAACGP